MCNLRDRWDLVCRLSLVAFYELERPSVKKNNPEQHRLTRTIRPIFSLLKKNSENKAIVMFKNESKSQKSRPVSIL